MELSSLSVSQMAKFEMCPRWWWYKTVGKRKEPFTAAQSEGVAAHSQIEHFLKTGENVLGRVALAAQHLLPQRSEHLLVEWGLHNKPKPSPEAYFFPPGESLVTAAGIGLIGFMDAVDSSPEHVLSEGEVIREEGVVECVDFKSTSNFRWSKKAEELPSNTQMAGYGRFITKAFPWATAVRLSHVSFLTKGEPAAKKETVVVPVDEINRTWDMAKEPLAHAMVDAARKGEHEVEGNLESCGNYGGCPHRQYCSAAKQSNSLQRMKSSMGLLKNRLAPAAPAVPPPATNGAVASTTPWIPPPPPVQPTAVPTRRITIKDESTPTGFTAGQAIQGQQYHVDGVQTMFLSRVSAGGGEKWSFIPVAGGQPILKDPHDAIGQLGATPAPQMAPPPAPVAPPVVFQPPAPPPAPQMAPPPPPAPVVARDVGAPPPPAPLAPPVAPEAKRGPGRPKKNAAAHQAQAEASPNAAAGSGLRIFVGCVPNSDFKTLDGYLNGILKEMQEEFGVTDIRCSPDRDSPISFGGWRGVLASLIRETPPLAGDYVVFTSGGDLMGVLVETLAPMCAPGCMVRAS